MKTTKHASAIEALQSILEVNEIRLLAAQRRIEAIRLRRTKLEIRMKLLTAQLSVYEQIVSALQEGKIKDDALVKRDKASKALQKAMLQYENLSVVGEKKLQARIAALSAANYSLHESIDNLLEEDHSINETVIPVSKHSIKAKSYPKRVSGGLGQRFNTFGLTSSHAHGDRALMAGIKKNFIPDFKTMSGEQCARFAGGRQTTGLKRK